MAASWRGCSAVPSDSRAVKCQFLVKAHFRTVEPGAGVKTFVSVVRNRVRRQFSPPVSWGFSLSIPPVNLFGTFSRPGLASPSERRGLNTYEVPLIQAGNGFELRERLHPFGRDRDPLCLHSFGYSSRQRATGQKQRDKSTFVVFLGKNIFPFKKETKSNPQNREGWTS